MNASSAQPLAVVIEDDVELSAIFQRALELAGYHAICMYDGGEALACLQQFIPEIVVMDLHLPTLSGDKIFQYIKTDERLAGTHIILATADSILADTMRDESDLVLVKPVSFSQLRALATRLRQDRQD